MDYKKIDVKANADLSEILIAYFGELPFDTFEEYDEGFYAYIPDNEWNNQIIDTIEGLKPTYQFSYEIIDVPYQNWNELWESNFEPILLEDYCYIRADFHPRNENVPFEITINPKMAFGSGHHSTTMMMLLTLKEVDFTSKRVLDFGGGTGILGIMASKLGANHIDSIDHEFPSYENTIENAEINHVDNITSYHGSLSLASGKYDIILANINRNVILQYAEQLSTLLKNDSFLITSGYYESDEKILVEEFSKYGIKLLSSKKMLDWCCSLFQKS